MSNTTSGTFGDADRIKIDFGTAGAERGVVSGPPPLTLSVDTAKAKRALEEFRRILRTNYKAPKPKKKWAGAWSPKKRR